MIDLVEIVVQLLHGVEEIHLEPVERFDAKRTFFLAA